MSKGQRRMLADIIFYSSPVVLIDLDLVTIGTDRNKVRQHPLLLKISVTYGYYGGYQHSSRQGTSPKVINT